MRLYPLLLLPLLACEHAPSGNVQATAAGTVASGASVGSPTGTSTQETVQTGPAPAGPAEVVALQTQPLPIRGLYVNRFAVQSWKKMHQLIAIADSTEINAFVIDIKDEFGLNWHSSDPVLQRNEGGMTKVSDLKAVIDTVRAHGILPIARIVVFKDSVAARMNPGHVILKKDGTPWRDKKGITWVNPYANAIWEYNFKVADEAIRMGFGEIQFDYIRFPEPYKSLPPQVFPETNGRSKPAVLREFLETANKRFDKQGIRTTADVFGLVTTVRGALEVGQEWEEISPVADVVLPMVYPSHYPRGAFGIDRPNAEPRKTILIALTGARKRDAKLGITTPEHVRAWLQAFTLGAPEYGPAQIEAEKQGVYDAGYDGWVLWHPGSKYEDILPALEKKLVSRKVTPPVDPSADARLD